MGAALLTGRDLWPEQAGVDQTCSTAPPVWSFYTQRRPQRSARGFLTAHRTSTAPRPQKRSLLRQIVSSTKLRVKAWPPAQETRSTHYTSFSYSSPQVRLESDARESRHAHPLHTCTVTTPQSKHLNKVQNVPFLVRDEKMPVPRRSFNKT